MHSVAMIRRANVRPCPPSRRLHGRNIINVYGSVLVFHEQELPINTFIYAKMKYVSVWGSRLEHKKRCGRVIFCRLRLKKKQKEIMISLSKKDAFYR